MPYKVRGQLAWRITPHEHATPPVWCGDLRLIDSQEPEACLEIKLITESQCIGGGGDGYVFLLPCRTTVVKLSEILSSRGIRQAAIEQQLGSLLHPAPGFITAIDVYATFLSPRDLLRGHDLAEFEMLFHEADEPRIILVQVMDYVSLKNMEELCDEVGMRLPYLES